MEVKLSPGERIILGILRQSNKPLSAPEIYMGVNYSQSYVHDCLKALIRLDLARASHMPGRKRHYYEAK